MPRLEATTALPSVVGPHSLALSSQAISRLSLWLSHFSASTVAVVTTSCRHTESIQTPSMQSTRDPSIPRHIPSTLMRLAAGTWCSGKLMNGRAGKSPRLLHSKVSNIDNYNSFAGSLGRLRNPTSAPRNSGWQPARCTAHSASCPVRWRLPCWRQPPAPLSPFPGHPPPDSSPPHPAHPNQATYIPSVTFMQHFSTPTHPLTNLCTRDSSLEMAARCKTARQACVSKGSASDGLGTHLDI